MTVETDVAAIKTDVAVIRVTTTDTRDDVNEIKERLGDHDGRIRVLELDSREAKVRTSLIGVFSVIGGAIAGWWGR